MHAFATGLHTHASPTGFPNGDVLIVDRKPGPACSLDQAAQGNRDGLCRVLATPAPTPDPATASRCCATPMATACPTSRPSSSIICIRRSAWCWSATISMSPIPTPVRYPYQEGDTEITAPGTTLTDLPGGPIDHHWTKSLTASPDGTKLYAGVGSNSNITENGIGAEKDRAAIWEIDRATGAHRLFATRPAQSQRPQLRAAERHAVGGGQRARRAGPRPRARLHDLGEGRRLLWLAL